MVAGGPGTRPPGWVRCPRAPATSDPFRIADPKGSYSARIVRERRSRIMRAKDTEPAGEGIPLRSESFHRATKRSSLKPMAGTARAKAGEGRKVSAASGNAPLERARSKRSHAHGHHRGKLTPSRRCGGRTRTRGVKDPLRVFTVVEVGGVEPPSENLSVQASTCVAGHWCLVAE